MTWTFVQKSPTTVGNVTITLTLPSPSTVGTLLVAALANSNGLSWSAPPGWIKAAGVKFFPTSIWYLPPNANPGGITGATFSTGLIALAKGEIAEFSTDVTSPTIFLSSTGGGSAGKVKSCSVTSNAAPAAGDLAVCCFAEKFILEPASVSWTVPAGFSTLADDSASDTMHQFGAYRILSNVGAITVTGKTNTAADNLAGWSGALATFEALPTVVPTAGLVGAYVDPTVFGTGTTIADAVAGWQNTVQRSLDVRRVHLNTLPSEITANDLLADISSGRKICASFVPPINPTSADIATLDAFLNSCKTAGLNMDVALFPAAAAAGLTAAQTIAAIRFYAPTVRQYYPLVFCTSVQGVNHLGENAYYPGDAYIDKIVTNYYASDFAAGERLYFAASLADAGSKPFGVWELGSSTDPVLGQSQQTVTAYFAYVQNYFFNRLQAGKENADLLVVDTNSTNATEFALVYDADVASLPLLAWWALADNAGSTIATDSSGNGHVGTPTNVTFGVSSPIAGNTSASFNGTTSKIDTSYNPAIGAFTLEAWINCNGLPLGTNPRIIANSHTSSETPAKGFELFLSSTGLPTLVAATASGVATAAGVTPVPATGWVYLTGEYDGSTLSLYVNSVLVASAPLSGTVLPGNSNISIGYLPTGNSNYFAGLIAEVALYPVAEPPPIIATHYTAASVTDYRIPLFQSLYDSQSNAVIAAVGMAVYAPAGDVVLAVMAAGGEIAYKDLYDSDLYGGLVGTTIVAMAAAPGSVDIVNVLLQVGVPIGLPGSPVTSPVRPSPARYVFLTTDLRTGTVLGEIPMTGVALDAQLNAPGNMSANANLDDPHIDNNEFVVRTQPGRTGFWAFRNDQIVWGGIIWTRQWTSVGKAFAITGQTFESYPVVRFPRSVLGTQVQTLTDGQCRLIQTLWTSMQSAKYGDIRVQPWDKFFKDDVVRTIVVNGWDLSTSFDDIIQNLLVFADGPDYTVIYSEDGTGRPRAQLQVEPIIGNPIGTTDLVLDYPGSIGSYTYLENAAAGANKWWAVGSGAGAKTIVGGANHTQSLASGWPLIEGVDIYNVSNAPTSQDQMDDLARSDAASLPVPLVTHSINALGQHAPQFGTYGLGDYAVANVIDPRFANGRTFVVRVIGWTINPPDSGQGEEVIALVFDEATGATGGQSVISTISPGGA